MQDSHLSSHLPDQLHAQRHSLLKDVDSSALPLGAIATLTCVRTGTVQPFTREQTSAINKAPIQQSVAVNYMGLLTDEQADRRHHGGHLKAVHQLPVATYAKLNAAFDLQVAIGTLGENLTTEPANGFKDMDESSVCIGDVFQYGGDPQAPSDGWVQLRIVQPRRPCYKINDQIGQRPKLPNIAAWISQQGIAGWYFQVVQDGLLNHDMPVYLIERPYPFATLERLWQLANLKTKVAAQEIAPWLAIDCLEQSWKAILTKKSK